MKQEHEQIARIPLYFGKGEVIAHAVVDEADVEWLSQWQWHLVKSGTGYAGRMVRRYGGVRAILMHREILGLPHGKSNRVTDHINHDTLDNRRANLRAVTQGQNLQNKRPYRNGTSKYRGVDWDKTKRRWRAEARLNGKHKHIGYFTSEDEAAAAASNWRAEHMPFAVETIQ
ncbi:MAG: HNH endonuclease [Dehalococcoidia bacterium]|nr:HNH endonuclease [Dehalococcoidia bacterium]